MGACAADQLRYRTNIFENTDAGIEKRLSPTWTMSLKKNIIFCDGEVFFLDRGLLMGA
jgi:hypothetical protein